MANTTLQQQHQPDAALFVLEPESSSPSPEAPAEQTSSLDVETQHKALGWGRPQVVSAASHRLKSTTSASPDDSSPATQAGGEQSSRPSSPGHSDPWCFEATRPSLTLEDLVIVQDSTAAQVSLAPTDKPVSIDATSVTSLGPASVLPLAPAVYRERATSLPGCGRPTTQAPIPASLASSPSAPVLKHPLGGDTAWWASPLRAAGPKRRRATSLTSETAQMTGAGWLVLKGDRPMSTSAATTVRWFSDPLPAARRALSASRRSSDALPSPSLPVFQTFMGESAPGSPLVPRIILPSGQTYEEEARWSIFEKLQPKDSTLQLILSEMSDDQPAADADTPSFEMLTTPSPWMAARRDYRRAVVRLVFILGLLVLFAAVGGGVVAVLERKARTQPNAPTA